MDGNFTNKKDTIRRGTALLNERTRDAQNCAESTPCFVGGVI